MGSSRLLLLSNSRNYGQDYLLHAGTAIKKFLGNNISKVLFCPFASVKAPYDDLTKLVSSKFSPLGYEVEAIHQVTSMPQAIAEAQAIVISGGNTFQLLTKLYQYDLISMIQTRIAAGVPYIGWSAGSNVACPTIKTTNDMPIVQPPSLTALGLVPFQINPHYTNIQLEGHQGETRDERLAEFIELNPPIHVVGLREGSMLEITDNNIALLGDKSVRLFFKGRQPWECAGRNSLQFLLANQSSA